MKTMNKNRKSKFLALLLSVMMVSSLGAAFASCKDETDSSSDSSSSSSSSTSDKTDTGLLKNANFDFTTVNSKNAIGTSVTGWSRSLNSVASGSAPGSEAASGVLNTDAEHWEYLTTSNYTDEQIQAMAKEEGNKEAVSKWDTFHLKDKLAFYDAWKDANKDGSISKDFSKYESLNVDEDDIPTVANPGTRKVNEGEELDSNILMIHNQKNKSSSVQNTQGTAQKYTSNSTITIPTGSSAEFSVWVKTVDLKCSTSNDVSQPAVGKGAYVRLTHSVGGKALDPFEVKNINTEAMDASEKDENGWVQYKFFIKGSYYCATTFSVVLGLGQSGGDDQMEYVNGYAFFDDMQCKIVSNADFETAKTENAIVDIITLADEQSDKKTVDAYTTETKAFALDFYTEWDSIANGFFDQFTHVATENDFDLTTNTDRVSNQDVIEVFDGRTDVYNTYTNDTTTKYEYLKYVYENYLTEKDEGEDNFIEDDKMLIILSQGGAAYTVENAYEFTLAANEDYKAISFFVKTSDFGSATGAGVTLVNGDNKTAISSISTATLSGVTIGDDDDAYDGWQQVFFFVEKDEDLKGQEASFTLTFNYGPTTINENTAATTFTQGFAAFAKFEEHTMTTKLEYETAQAGTYAKKVVLTVADDEEITGNSGFDSAAATPSDALENGLANAQNYKGVYSDSYYVKKPAANEGIDETKRKINQNDNAGVLNKDAFIDEENDIVTKNTGKAWFDGLKAASGKTTAKEIWDTVFGEDTTQPLMIWNTTSSKSYGFIGSTQSISSSETVVSLRVKTSATATASVYLIDMSEENRNNPLSISRGLTYWYDDNGNVCTGDPAKSSTQIAFKLQKNGLYLANENWDGYEKLDAAIRTQYFANLSAYTKNSNGDLIAAETSASHAYHDYTWNREVFYAHDGKFYTEDNGNGVQVLDLLSITKTSETDTTNPLPYRYLAEEGREMKIENISTNGEWVTVSFYLRKGEIALNYRLEVWSGTRDGAVVNPGDSYVIFDYNNPGSATDNFALIDEYKDNADDTFEGVFSYFDTDNYVRYDAAKDSDKVGNLYAESFVPSTETAGTAYLAYTEKATGSNQIVRYEIFADYSLFDKTVTAQTETDDDVTEDEHDHDDGELNVWLLASSIAVAGVLVLAVLSIVARKIIEKAQKKHGTFVRKPKTNKTKKTK